MKTLQLRLDEKHYSMLTEIKNIIANEMHIEVSSITDSELIRWAIANFYHFKTTK